MWAFFLAGGCPDRFHALHMLDGHIGAISQVVFFLLGALAIVELIDAHQGFNALTSLFQVRSKRVLLWAIGGTAFFLSAILDNLTTTIVMVSATQSTFAQR